MYNGGTFINEEICIMEGGGFGSKGVLLSLFYISLYLRLSEFAYVLGLSSRSFKNTHMPFS